MKNIVVQVLAETYANVGLNQEAPFSARKSVQGEIYHVAAH